MTDKPTPTNEPENDNLSDTLIVPPPNFKERLLAAQRARANEVRPSVGIPIPPHIPGEFPVQPSAKISGESVVQAAESSAPAPIVQPPTPEPAVAPAAPPVNETPTTPGAAEPASSV